MNGKTKQTITYLLLIAIVMAVITVYFIWNKKHTDVTVSTGIKVEAGVLYQNFSTDSASANIKYIQQVLEVSGMIGSLEKTQDNKTIVLLKTTVLGANINCTMEVPAVELIKGSQVIIKGICNGIGQGDAELGILGDVYLVRCYLKSSTKVPILPHAQK